MLIYYFLSLSGMRRSALALTALLAGCRAHMEAPLPKPFSYPMAEGGRAALALERHRERYLAGPDAWMYAQALAQYRALAGDYRGALAAWDETGAKDRGAAPDFEGVGPEDAATLLLREAERRQAFLINEAHHDPRHRAFTRSLLAGLRERGYRYFAAEAFGEEDPDLAARGAPSRATGGYVSEPQFAELVREALRLGFVPVAYEDQNPCADLPGEPDFCPNQRDRNQAQILKSRVFDKDPRAKVVVHAGFDHIRKNGRGKWRTMALVLRELTGVGALSVDQVELAERSAPAFERAAYKAALEAFKPEGPVVLSAADGTGWVLPEDKGAYDFHVLHPRAAVRHGRPDWVFSGRSAVGLPAGLCPAVPCAVEAFYEGDDPAAAPPADAFLARDLAALPALALAPGRYRVRALGPAGTTARDVAVEAR